MMIYRRHSKLTMITIQNIQRALTDQLEKDNAIVMNKKYGQAIHRGNTKDYHP